MRRTRLVHLLALACAALVAPRLTGQPVTPTLPKGAPKDAPKDASQVSEGFVRFRTQEIDTSIGVGYAVLPADVNADGKPDIVVVDTHRVVWYENPTWKRRTVMDGQARPDNVCLAAADIDGDGQLDFALGAGWRAMNTKDNAPLTWLKRGQTLDEPWTSYPIGGEPNVHRMRFADTDGDGKPELVVVPLMGRDSTRAGNWMDGRPVRILAYPIPADPVKGPWEPRVLNETLHVVHNFQPIPAEGRKGSDLLAASYEGVSLLSRGSDGQWGARRLGAGNQLQPLKERGASEVKRGSLRGERKFIATIEPWHGQQVVVYTPSADSKSLWDRQLIDSRLRWGHAVWCADLDGDGEDELIVGVRDNAARSDTFTTRYGVRVYKCRDGLGKQWHRELVDEGGVAVEDLAAADLNGDGRIDLVAVGRATGNVRIYWNEK